MHRKVVWGVIVRSCQLVATPLHTPPLPCSVLRLEPAKASAAKACGQTYQDEVIRSRGSATLRLSCASKPSLHVLWRIIEQSLDIKLNLTFMKLILPLELLFWSDLVKYPDGRFHSFALFQVNCQKVSGCKFQFSFEWKFGSQSLLSGQESVGGADVLSGNRHLGPSRVSGGG